MAAQVQASEGILAQEQSNRAETLQQLEGYREILAAAGTAKRQLQAQLTDLETQQSNSQAALQALQAKLTASEAELAQAGQDAKQLRQQVTHRHSWCLNELYCNVLSD